MIEIKVGDFDVLDSGTVTSVGSRDVLFTLSERVKVRLVFTIIDNKNQEMTIQINERGELEFTLQNFDNPLGTEFNEPIEIGTWQGRKLFLHARVLGLKGTNNRVVLYTWYLGNRINNG